MFPIWRKRMIYPREDAQREMNFYGIDLYGIIDILDDPEAFDCESSRRKKDIIVRCVKRGRKIIKVVVEEATINLGDTNYPAWRIRHVGKTSLKRR